MLNVILVRGMQCAVHTVLCAVQSVRYSVCGVQRAAL